MLAPVTLGIIIATIAIKPSLAQVNRDKYFLVDFNVFDGTETKPFKYTDSKEQIQGLGLNKGKKYRWLIADCMADIQTMMELAKVFKSSLPEENVIIVTWEQVVTKDPKFRSEDGAGYAEFRTALEHVSNVIVYAHHKIHISLYDSQHPSVLDNSHLIGLGHAGLIAGHAGWVGNHKEEQIKEPGGAFGDYTIENYETSRITVINPVSFCNRIGDESQKRCQQVEEAKPGYKKELFNIESAKFIDGLYTHSLGLSVSFCARQNSSKGLPHHRAIMVNEETVPPACENENQNSMKTNKMCSFLLKNCFHQSGFQLYTEAMRVYLGPKTGCHDVMDLMLGDTDPNVPGETFSTNFHLETKDLNPFGSDLGCKENPIPLFPKGRTIIEPRCKDQDLQVNKIKGWSWNRY